ncbi:tyrosine-type recombinase/integrase, partial [Fictibacillus gelatini]|uniref:tyrosine-type recombinase/integrase n=1 Tax=Fictibacillus gelatini TaxID=225985 RepID=UPI0004786D4F
MAKIIQMKNIKQTTLKEIEHLFLDYRRSMGVSENTFLQNETNLKLFLSWCEENDYQYIEELSPFVMSKYIAFLYQRSNLKTDRKLSISTIGAHIKVLRILSKFLKRRSFLMEDIMEDILPPPPPHRIIETFTDEQIKLIFKNTDQKKYKILFYLLLTTGLRISEALSLKPENFHFDRRLIRIIGKGNKQREVPFSLDLQRYIKEYIAEMKKQHGEYIWESRKEGKLSTAAVRNELYRIQRKVGNETGLDRIQVRPHIFRHTFAKKWIMAGG